MNCINHPSEVAVAQCADCGKGLCIQCAANRRIPLCTSCRQARKKNEITRSVLFLAVYTGLFIFGYKTNFMSSKGTPDACILSGYVSMAIVSGWQFLNAVVRWRLVEGSLVSWAIYYVLKLFIAAITGFFTAPITIVWNIVKIVRNSMR